MEQLSISGVKQVELQQDGKYLVEYYNSPSTMEKGIIDSVYHDGKHRAPLTLTFNISDHSKD